MCILFYFYFDASPHFHERGDAYIPTKEMFHIHRTW